MSLQRYCQHKQANPRSKVHSTKKVGHPFYHCSIAVRALTSEPSQCVRPLLSGVALISSSPCVLGEHRIFTSPLDGLAVSTRILPESRRSMQQLHVDGSNPINWSEERLIHWHHHLSVLNCGHWRKDGGNLPCQVASKDSSEFLGNTLDKFGLRSWMSVCGCELSSHTSNEQKKTGSCIQSKWIGDCQSYHHSPNSHWLSQWVAGGEEAEDAHESRWRRQQPGLLWRLPEPRSLRHSWLFDMLELIGASSVSKSSLSHISTKVSVNPSGIIGARKLLIMGQLTLDGNTVAKVCSPSGNTSSSTPCGRCSKSAKLTKGMRTMVGDSSTLFRLRARKVSITETLQGMTWPGSRRSCHPPSIASSSE